MYVNVLTESLIVLFNNTQRFVRSLRQVVVYFKIFFFLSSSFMRFGPFSGHGLPGLLPPYFSLSLCCVPGSVSGSYLRHFAKQVLRVFTPSPFLSSLHCRGFCGIENSSDFSKWGRQPNAQHGGSRYLLLSGISLKTFPALTIQLAAVFEARSLILLKRSRWDRNSIAGVWRHYSGHISGTRQRERTWLSVVVEIVNIFSARLSVCPFARIRKSGFM